MDDGNVSREKKTLGCLNFIQTLKFHFMNVQVIDISSCNIRKWNDTLLCWAMPFYLLFSCAVYPGLIFPIKSSFVLLHELCQQQILLFCPIWLPPPHFVFFSWIIRPNQASFYWNQAASQKPEGNAESLFS